MQDLGCLNLNTLVSLGILLGHCGQLMVESVDPSGFAMVPSGLKRQVLSIILAITPRALFFFVSKFQNPKKKHSKKPQVPHFPYIFPRFPRCFHGLGPGWRELHLGGLLFGLLHLSQSRGRSRLRGVARQGFPGFRPRKWQKFIPSHQVILSFRLGFSMIKPPSASLG